MPEELQRNTTNKLKTNVYINTQSALRQSDELTPGETYLRPHFELAGHEDTSTSVADALTDKQRRVLLTAYENGYYDKPREITQRDLGKLVDRIGRTTGGKHLTRGINNLVHEHFNTETDQSPDLTDAEREGLELAYERGFYEEPREISQSELGEELGINGASVSTRLKRAVRRLITTHLNTDSEKLDVHPNTLSVIFTPVDPSESDRLHDRKYRNEHKFNWPTSIRKFSGIDDLREQHGEGAKEHIIMHSNERDGLFRVEFTPPLVVPSVSPVTDDDRTSTSDVSLPVTASGQDAFNVRFPQAVNEHYGLEKTDDTSDLDVREGVVAEYRLVEYDGVLSLAVQFAKEGESTAKVTSKVKYSTQTWEHSFHGEREATIINITIPHAIGEIMEFRDTSIQYCMKDDELIIRPES